MHVTLFGIVILVKPVQPENASYPMLVTLFGIVILVKPVQPENAQFPILVPPVITTVFSEAGTELVPPKITLKLISPVPSALDPTYGSVMLVRLLQSSNTDSPTPVTLFGIAMLVILLQSPNARLPILVTLSGIVTFIILLQL